MPETYQPGDIVHEEEARALNAERKLRESMEGVVEELNFKARAWDAAAKKIERDADEAGHAEWTKRPGQRMRAKATAFREAAELIREAVEGG